MGALSQHCQGAMEELSSAHNGSLSAAKTFKSRTGLGCDSAHPRKFGWLSEEVLLGLASLLTMIEDSGIWPEQVSVILIALIPKPGGGKRPIGILPG